LLLWIHMYGCWKRFVLPASDSSRRQQAALIMGPGTRG
jgi:hypothetical protein